MAIITKIINNDKCSSCNASGLDGALHEFSISRSNTIQGSMLYFRLCANCVREMKDILTRIESGDYDR